MIMDGLLLSKIALLYQINKGIYLARFRLDLKG
jgi:hypothetical protein